MPRRAVRLVFLGTGASGGTPGRGRSRRRESSLLVEGDVRVLVDVTRDAGAQLDGRARPDAVLLTHAHRDATGGIMTLRDAGAGPVPLFAHVGTIAALRQRYARLDHCEMVPVAPGRRFRFGPWWLSAIEVPHAAEPDTPTLAWKVVTGAGTVVYASDVATPEPRLARFARGADVLAVDGATYGRTIFTHLRIDRDLPSICAWDVARIFLTQIGRSAPAHAVLERRVAALCARARPAYDGLVVDLDRPRRAVRARDGDRVSRAGRVPGPAARRRSNPAP